jgi:aldehyde dehydrogenase (NAD+)
MTTATASLPLSQIARKQQAFFKTHATKDVSFRIEQLKKLKRLISENESLLLEALNHDLGKSSAEAYMTEIGIVQSELGYFIGHLKQLTKPKRVNTPLQLFHSSGKIVHEPLGSILIISPWNYPVNLCFVPLAGAIAAGNCAVLKPSEKSSHTSEVIHKIISENFSEEYIACYTGDAAVAQQLLEQKWDFIFFTGNSLIGKIVYQKAAEHLTPVCLELGGKNPCIVDETANLSVSAKRIAWGKCINSGQTCIAPDFLYVHDSVKDKLVAEIRQYIQQFYGENPAGTKEYPKLISREKLVQLSRLAEIDVDEKVLAIQKMNPVVIELDNEQHDLMKDELFGPVLPVISYTGLDEVIHKINEGEKPLAIYLFSQSSNNQEKVIRNTSSGGMCINEIIMHVANHELPFGGVGQSGINKYHGEHSFRLFTNAKPVLKSSTLLDIPMRYAPFSRFEKWVRLFLR